MTLTKATGDFGEYITAFLLGKRFEEHGITIVKVGSENLPYDLIIPHPVDGTPFNLPTAISVKTRGTWSDVIPPTKEQIKRTQEQLQQYNFDFWIAFVKYQFEKGGLHFEAYLLQAIKLDYSSDFKKVTRKKGPEEQILTENLMKKADLRFFSN